MARSENMRPQDFVSIDAQIAEVEREINIRRRVYKGWIAKGKMTSEQARSGVVNMLAVRETLLAYKHGSKNRENE